MLKTESLPDFSSLKEIFVIRHGQSEGQLNYRLYKEIGDDQLSLTPLGHKQATAAGIALNNHLEGEIEIDHSSSLRATQTAQNVSKGITGIAFQVAANQKVDKQKFGDFDGHFSDQERQAASPQGYAAYSQQLKDVGCLAATPPNGESTLDVIRRVSNYLQEASQSDATKVVVTHGLVALSIEKLLLEKGDKWLIENQDTTENCSILHLYQDENGTFQKQIISLPEAILS